MPTPVILFYDPIPSPWAGKLKAVCAIQGLWLHAVENAQLDRPLLSLPDGGIGETEARPEPLPEPVMVLCGLTGPQLDRLLPALRKERIFCLKALLTPTNVGWTLRQLYTELCREREELEAHRPEG